MTHETVEGFLRAAVENMQKRAVEVGWFACHPEWNELNRKRQALGMRNVCPVDKPTKEHFDE